MSDDMLKIGQFAELAGVSISTLRNWDASGKLVPEYVSPGGTRFYRKRQLNSIKCKGDKGLTVAICSDKRKLVGIMSDANRIKKGMDDNGVYCDLILINSNEMDMAVYYISEIMDKIYNKKLSYLYIVTDSDNFIYRLIKQCCTKNELSFSVKEV